MVARVVACIFFACAHSALAAVFLKSRSDAKILVDQDFVQQSLSVALGMSMNKVQLLEDELRPLFQALPKDEHGLLEGPVVRYAVSRWYMRKNSWQVIGLDEDVVDKVPGYMLHLFESRLNGRGFGLKELAIYVATISELIHKEIVIDLEAVYSLLKLEQDSLLSPQDSGMLLRAYEMRFLLAEHGLHNETYEVMSREVKEYYEPWEELTMWADDMFVTVEWDQSRVNPFASHGTYESVETVVREMGERYHSFQQAECETLKDVLVAQEYRGTGRVLLKDYYAYGFNTEFKFWESPNYLRTLGALDETDPKHPALIIPNFYASRANCVGSSNFYFACCQDECAGLMTRLEAHVAAPLAPPEQIAQFIANLPSDTVEAPRNLSMSMVSRLEDIAKLHDGQVPLHGRLFAQWMHHSYPRECAQPHSGIAITIDDFEKEFGEDAALSEASLQMHVRRQQRVKHEKAEDLPWSSQEELLSVHKVGTRSGSNDYWRIALGLVGILSVVVPLVRSSKAALHASQASSSEKNLFV